MSYTSEDRAIALAGVVQAGALVADIARGRAVDEQALAATLRSVFVADPQDVPDVFGGVEGVRLGLIVLRDALDAERQRTHGEVIRYALHIVQAERRFAGRDDLQRILHARMDRAREQLAYFEVTHETIVGALAEIYQDTLSKLRFRVQVVGDAASLREERNTDRIRAVLLGGVRATVLWHQTGGRRWRLVLNRKAVHHAASRVVDRLI